MYVEAARAELEKALREAAPLVRWRVIVGSAVHQPLKVVGEIRVGGADLCAWTEVSGEAWHCMERERLVRAVRRSVGVVLGMATVGLGGEV